MPTTSQVGIIERRLVPNAMEPRASLAEYHAGDESDSPQPAKPACGSVGTLRVQPNRTGAQASRHRTGCWWETRLEDLYLCGRNRMSLGVQDQSSSNGMPSGRDPSRRMRTAAITSRPLNCPRRRRQVHWYACPYGRKSRSLSIDLCICVPASIRGAVGRSVHDAEYLLRRARCLHKHRTGRCLSRRRPTEAFVVEQLLMPLPAKWIWIRLKSGEKNMIGTDAYPYQAPVIQQYDCGIRSP